MLRLRFLAVIHVERQTQHIQTVGLVGQFLLLCKGTLYLLLCFLLLGGQVFQRCLVLFQILWDLVQHMVDAGRIAHSIRTQFYLLGQLVVERIYHYAVPISVFITVGGGVYFLYLLLSNRRV